MFAGEQNCDYSFQHIQDREDFEATYAMYAGNLDPKNVGAFLVSSEKTVFFSHTDMKTILHEIEHIKCRLAHNTLKDIEFCDKRLDMIDVTGKSRRAI